MVRSRLERILYEIHYVGYDGKYREEEQELLDPERYAHNLEEYGCENISIYNLETGDLVYGDYT